MIGIATASHANSTRQDVREGSGQSLESVASESRRPVRATVSAAKRKTRHAAASPNTGTLS